MVGPAASGPQDTATATASATAACQTAQTEATPPTAQTEATPPAGSAGRPARSPVLSAYAGSGQAPTATHSREAQTGEDLLHAWVAERAPAALDPSHAQIAQAMGAEMRRTIGALHDFVGCARPKGEFLGRKGHGGPGLGGQGHSPTAAHPRGSLASRTSASSPRTASAAQLQDSRTELHHLRAGIVDSARALQAEVDQMTQGSVSYRTVQVAGLPGARTADGALDARVSIQVRTRDPPRASPRGGQAPHLGNPNVSPHAASALPRLKLTEEGPRRPYLSSSTEGSVAAGESSARRRQDFVEPPRFVHL